MIRIKLPYYEWPRKVAKTDSNRTSSAQLLKMIKQYQLVFNLGEDVQRQKEILNLEMDKEICICVIKNSRGDYPIFISKLSLLAEKLV